MLVPPGAPYEEPGEGHRSSAIEEHEFSPTRFHSAARRAQTPLLGPYHSQKNERQREAGEPRV